MRSNELKKLSRADLLELLVAESTENEHLRSELTVAKQQLASRALEIEEAGSIAEASLRLSGVFEAAQDAAARYIENLESLSSHQDEIRARREAASKAKADALIVEAHETCLRMEAQTREECELMLARAKREAESYINDRRVVANNAPAHRVSHYEDKQETLPDSTSVRTQAEQVLPTKGEPPKTTAGAMQGDSYQKVQLSQQIQSSSQPKLISTTPHLAKDKESKSKLIGRHARHILRGRS